MIIENKMETLLDIAEKETGFILPLQFRSAMIKLLSHSYLSGWQDSIKVMNLSYEEVQK